MARRGVVWCGVWYGVVWYGDIPFYFFCRDVPETESLIELHQQRKSEIDAREEGFSSVVLMGKTLLARDHYASEDVSLRYNVLLGVFSELVLS